MSARAADGEEHMSRQGSGDLGTEAAGYFEPFARAVASACMREGRTASTVSPDGRIGVYGLTVAEFARLADRYGYGEATPERLVRGPLQHDLSRALLSEHWRREIRWVRDNVRHPEAMIPTAAERATRSWLADRAAVQAGIVARPYTIDPERFVESVLRGMGLEARTVREPIQTDPRRSIGDVGLSLSPA